MNNILKEKTEQWMALERKTFEQRAIAEKFYEEELMGQITKEFVTNNKGVIDDVVEYMIVSVGTSYEPLVLSISLLKPKKICFLYTEQSEATIDKVADFCKLKFSQVEKAKVNETESTDVYREIKRCFINWGRPNKVFIDFTGGTKAMSTAAAMAGAVINVEMLYVGTNNYMTDFRKPFPGSERLHTISNPMEIFGDIEIEKAYALFDEYNYSAVCERLGNLKESVPDPRVRQDLNFLYSLAKTYEYWDGLDFSAAYESICVLNKEISRDMRQSSDFVLSDKSSILKRQEKLLFCLNELPLLMKEKRQMDILSSTKYIYPLMFTMYQNALVREEQEKYDMATLLFYRLLEMIEQRRLSNYGLYVSKMNYHAIPTKGNENIDDSIKRLKDSVFELKKAVFGKCNSNYLQEQVSLLEGFIILSALTDDIMRESAEHVNRLKRIRAMVGLRNNSIFAHGLAPVKKTDYIKFKCFVEEMFKELCHIERVNFDKYYADIKWINPNEGSEHIWQ